MFNVVEVVVVFMGGSVSFDDDASSPQAPATSGNTMATAESNPSRARLTEASLGRFGNFSLRRVVSTK